MWLTPGAVGVDLTLVICMTVLPSGAFAPVVVRRVGPQARAAEGSAVDQVHRGTGPAAVAQEHVSDGHVAPPGG